MILDNQNLPEIVVSREAIRNNNIGAPVNSGPFSLPSACASTNEVSNVASNLAAPARKPESPQHRPAQSPRSPRHNYNEARNPGGGDTIQHLPQQQPSPPAAGWDDAPGSPHRIPLVTNNNGSPRLTNRIANIYGVTRHQGVPRQQTALASPHGSPRHQAIARIVSPNPENLRIAVRHLSKNDASVPGSPKFANVCKVGKDHTSDSDQTVELSQESCNSPKRIFFLNQSPSHGPGYHNPYQQTNYVKSPLLQSNEMKFRYDSPKHKLKNSVDSPRHVSTDKPPLSPRPHCNSQNNFSVDERRSSNDNSFCNDNECSSPGSYRLQKSRIPCKIPIPNQTDAKTTELVCAMNSQNNLRVFKALHAASPKKIRKMSSAQSHVALDNISNPDVHCEIKTNSNLTRRDHSNPDAHDDLNDPYQYLKADRSISESNHSFEDSKSESDVGGQNSLGSTEWNSGEYSLNHPNTSSWNTNTEHSDCDQKMSIDDKHSLKRSSVDSLRPRTSSLGSWPHSSLGSQDKSYPPGSMGGSVGGIETISDTDSGMVDSVSSKMVLIKCKDGTYLSRVFLNTDGIQGVKVVGRVGGSGVPSPAPSGAASSTPRTTSPGRPSHTAPMSAAASPLHHPVHTKGGVDSTSGSCGGESCSVSGSERSGGPHEGEFDHDTADYQWLLDYESPFPAPDKALAVSCDLVQHSSYGSSSDGLLSDDLIFSDHFNLLDSIDDPIPSAKHSSSNTHDAHHSSSNSHGAHDTSCRSRLGCRLVPVADGTKAVTSYSTVMSSQQHLYATARTDSSFKSTTRFIHKRSGMPHNIPDMTPDSLIMNYNWRSSNTDSSLPSPDSLYSNLKSSPLHTVCSPFPIDLNSLSSNTYSSSLNPACSPRNPAIPEPATNHPRYRESYTRESLGSGGREGSTRASVLDTNPEPDLQELSYETLSRNLDANLAEIDMDDFRSDDIHQLLTLPSVCGHCTRDPNEGDGQASAGQSVDNTPTRSRRHSHHHHHHHPCRHSAALRHRHEEYGLEDEDGHPYSVEYDLEEEELSGVSGDISLCQSGPLFSPLKEPPPLGNTTFSVDSLDCDSLHEDLILTCQANKDNYTIAFEGSFIQYSEESDYQEAGGESASIAGESDTTGSESWPAERLEGRSPAPAMTHSDQPYTTWSRVSRRTTTPCRTPDPANMAKGRNMQHLSPAGRQQQQQLLLKQQQQQEKNAAAAAPDAQEAEPGTGATGDLEEQGNNKSNSMPNLMRRSLMRQSLDTGGQCIKVFDLQNSLRSSQTSGRQTEGNSFSLVRLFMKQKSLSKEAISLSSSCTSRSHEGACCTSSENQSGVDSSDWPMNSQSDDMEGSASPVPLPGLRHHHHQQQGMVDRAIRRRSGGDLTTRNYNTNSGEYTTSSHNATEIISPTTGTAVMTDSEGSLVNNNNAVNQILDNTGGTTATAFDNTASFEESLKEVCPCSKAPVTSPIREEPEGMDISFDSRSENKLVIDQSETETKSNASLSSVDNKSNNYMDGSTSPVKTSLTTKNPPNKNTIAVQSEDKQRSQSPGTPKRSANRRESSHRQRQDSGNSSSGYASTKGSTERIRRPSDSSGQHQVQRPRPKPRALKQMADQCLQTSNLKVSAAMNTSHILDRKDVYVYYPNYALPDLSFLKDKKYSGDARIFLVPQHYSRSPLDLRKMRDARCKRPFSCNDMEKLRRRGLAHVKDWDSLNVLLPKELKEMLSDNTDCMETVKPSFCISPKSPRRPTSCDFSSQRQSSDIKESCSNTSLNSTQPSSGYRGSSTMLNESEENTSGEVVQSGDNPPSIPRRSVSLQLEEEEGEQPPPRPPLPRGILRKTTSLKDDPQKGGVKKRHSVADSAGALARDDAKRRSLQEPMDALAKKTSKGAIIEQPCRTEGNGSMVPGSDMGCSCINTCTGFCNKGLKRKNLLRVSELPDVSAHEEFTEQDLAALRARVSNFLVGKNMDEDMECELCPKKSVTFEERGCTHMRKMGDNSGVVSNQMSNTTSTPPQQPSEERPLVYDAQDKRALVMSVRAAVERLVTLFSQTQGQHSKNKLTASGLGCAVSQITLDKLCPALYALLSDGLQPCLHSLFGRIANSVWRVIEATSQMGPSTKALNDLVLTLNSEDCLTEGPMKFNAFIFGLLNIRSLDSWLSYLRTRESTLQKHYHPDSFLYLANTATRSLFDDLLLALRPLSLLPLHLDLLYEYKLLHASLLKMEERLLLHTSGSTTQSPLERPSSGLLDHLLVAKETKEFKNTAAAQQDRVKALMRVLTSPEATEADLLQTVTSTVNRERSKTSRPRSCYDNVLVGDDLHPALKKRWSNVQLGSKLITAIDKLMLEEATGASGSSSDYTDSIDNPKPHRNSSIGSEDEIATDMRVSDISSKDDDISERSATDKDTENEKGHRICPTSLNYSKEQESEGEKFRRLQMKWERMAGCENKSSSNEEHTSPETSSASPVTSSSASPSTATATAIVAVSPSQASRDKVVSPSSGTRSRIPRPVSMTSPQRPFKPFDPVKEKTSPLIKPPMHTSRPIGGPLSAGSGKELPKPAPRRSLKDRSFDRQEDTPSSQTPSRPLSVRSRIAPKGGSVAGAVTATGNRASSMPGRSDSSDRGANTAQGWGGRYDIPNKKATGASAGAPGPRSASHGRRLIPGVVPRYVQTLHHRLATDNGHLSFNRGDVLTVVVEVDDRYLLCCLNDRKGLVPRASIIVCSDQ